MAPLVVVQAREAARQIASNARSRATPLIVFAAVVALFIGIDGAHFGSGHNIATIATATGVTAPLVMGETVVLIGGGIDISVGAVLAMTAALAIGLQPLGWVLASVLAIAFGAVEGLVNGLLVTKGNLVPFIATLGTMSVVTGLDLSYTHESGMSGTIPAFDVLGQGSIGMVPLAFVISLALLGVLHLVMNKTGTGRSIFAIGSDTSNAAIAGINVARTTIIAFVVCGSLTGVSGVLLASELNSASPQIGVQTVIQSLAAAIIGGASLLGGRGSVAGAFVGIASLSALSSGMDVAGVPIYFEIGITASVMIAVVVIDALVVRSFRRKQSGASILAPLAEPSSDEGVDDGGGGSMDELSAGS